MARSKYHFRPYKLNDDRPERPRQDKPRRKAVPKPAPAPTYAAEGLMAILKQGDRLPQDAFARCMAWAKEHEYDWVGLPKGGSALICGLSPGEMLPIAIAKLYS